MPSTPQYATDRTILWVPSESSDCRPLIERVAGEFNFSVTFCSPEELLQLIPGERYEFVGVELGAQPATSLSLLAEVHRRRPHLTLLAASADTDVTTMRAALDAGASDFLRLPLNEHDLHKALIKFTQYSTKVGSLRATRGEVITVYGVRGGLGATTIAVNLAVRLAALTKSRVALMDLDLQRGDVAAYLNLAPAQSLAAIAGAPGEVDELFLLGTLARHDSGVFVLAAPAHIAEADSIGAEAVELAIRLLRAQFRYTVVDTARALAEPALVAFEQAERILLLTDLSVPGVRAARRMLEVLERIHTRPEQIELLVIEGARGLVKIDDAVRTLGREPYFVLPRDEVVAGQSMNAGAPLNGGRESKLPLAIAELAAKLAGVPAAERGGRLLRRIFGRGKGVPA